MQRSLMLAVRNTLLTASLLTACYEEGPRLCPNGPNEATADTLIGARVDGRSVLVGQGTPVRSAELSPDGSYLFIFGLRTEDSPPQSLDIRVYNFHGVGSYPLADSGDPSKAWAAYGCGYWGGDPQTQRDGITFYPLIDGMEGDSIWVTAWDSVSGRVRGTFAFHSYDTEGDLVTISDGTFDAQVSRP